MECNILIYDKMLCEIKLSFEMMPKFKAESNPQKFYWVLKNEAQ